MKKVAFTEKEIEFRLLHRIHRAVINNKFNFEKVMQKKTYFGFMCNVVPLFCSYGQIGYVVNTRFGQVICDFDLNKIEIEKFDK